MPVWLGKLGSHEGVRTPQMIIREVCTSRTGLVGEFWFARDVRTPLLACDQSAQRFAIILEPLIENSNIRANAEVAYT